MTPAVPVRLSEMTRTRTAAALIRSGHLLWVGVLDDSCSAVRSDWNDAVSDCCSLNRFCKPLLGWSFHDLCSADSCRGPGRVRLRNQCVAAMAEGHDLGGHLVYKFSAAHLQRGSHVGAAHMTRGSHVTGADPRTPAHGLPARLTPGYHPECQRTACPPKLIPR